MSLWQRLKSFPGNAEFLTYIYVQAVVGEWPEDTLYEDVLKNGVLLCRFFLCKLLAGVPGVARGIKKDDI